MDDTVQAEKKDQIGKGTTAGGGSIPGLKIMETIPVQETSEKPCCGSPSRETIESKIMFLARPEGGSRIFNTATTDNAAQKHYLGFYIISDNANKAVAAISSVKGLLSNGMGHGAALAFGVAGPVTTISAMTAVFALAKRQTFALSVKPFQVPVVKSFSLSVPNLLSGCLLVPPPSR
jgi:hypothetical protein